MCDCHLWREVSVLEANAVAQVYIHAAGYLQKDLCAYQAEKLEGLWEMRLDTHMLWPACSGDSDSPCRGARGVPGLHKQGRHAGAPGRGAAA